MRNGAKRPVHVANDDEFEEIEGDPTLFEVTAQLREHVQPGGVDWGSEHVARILTGSPLRCRVERDAVRLLVRAQLSRSFATVVDEKRMRELCAPFPGGRSRHRLHG